jgi:hypothetical protein
MLADDLERMKQRVVELQLEHWETRVRETNSIIKAHQIIEQLEENSLACWETGYVGTMSYQDCPHINCENF